MKILKCIAWVIGINHYDNYPELHAAVNDAKEFSEKLKLLGYEVIESIDDGKNQEGTYNKIIDRKQDFLDKILDEKPDVALLYFAGHGCMVNREDCLILSDAAAYRKDSVKARDKSIVLKELCQNMNGNGGQMNLLIVDACRVAVETDEQRGKVEYTEFGKNTRLPFQTLFAFSTSPEDTAADGQVHSPYTQLLLNKMLEKDLPIESLFKSVRRDLRLTGRRQLGQELTSLVDSYCFNYGQMEDGAILEYAETALADARFQSSNEVFMKCLELFKSYNYYQQEDGLDLFHQSYKTFSNDELFVMGRNILQAACGGCWKCSGEIMFSKLKLYQVNGRNAVLDGILYEMYFDSNNEVRSSVKGCEFLSQIDKLTIFDEFKSSFRNIQKVLAKYRDRFVYVPGDKVTYTVKVEMESLGKNEFDDPIWQLQSITFNGTDIKSQLSNLPKSFDKGKLRESICSYLAIPMPMLNLVLPNEVEDDASFCVAQDLDELLLALN